MKKTIFDSIKPQKQFLVLSKAFPILLQIHVVAGLFGLEVADAIKFAKNLPEDPEEGECYLAFPRVSSVARENFPTITDPDKQYFATVNLLCEKFERHMGLRNNNDMVLYGLTQENTTQYYTMEDKTRAAIAFVEEKQKGDILIVSAQFGCLRIDQSVEEVRATLSENEFGLTMLMLGLMMFMHPSHISQGSPKLIAVGENISRHHAPSYHYHYMDGKYEHLRTKHIEFYLAVLGKGGHISPCTGYML
jgi:hypothetical protein